MTSRYEAILLSFHATVPPDVKDSSDKNIKVHFIHIIPALFMRVETLYLS